MRDLIPLLLLYEDVVYFLTVEYSSTRELSEPSCDHGLLKCWRVDVIANNNINNNIDNNSNINNNNNKNNNTNTNNNNNLGTAVDQHFVFTGYRMQIWQYRAIL